MDDYYLYSGASFFVKKIIEVCSEYSNYIYATLVIKKGKKTVDLSVVVATFYFGALGYQIASERRSTDELLDFLIVLGIIYFITNFTIQMIVIRNNEKIKENND